MNRKCHFPCVTWEKHKHRYMLWKRHPRARSYGQRGQRGKDRANDGREGSGWQQVVTSRGATRLGYIHAKPGERKRVDGGPGTHNRGDASFAFPVFSRDSTSRLAFSIHGGIDLMEIIIGPVTVPSQSSGPAARLRKCLPQHELIRINQRPLRIHGHC